MSRVECTVGFEIQQFKSRSDFKSSSFQRVRLQLQLQSHPFEKETEFLLAQTVLYIKEIYYAIFKSSRLSQKLSFPLVWTIDKQKKWQPSFFGPLQNRTLKHSVFQCVQAPISPLLKLSVVLTVISGVLFARFSTVNHVPTISSFLCDVITS